jgi:hypothetical protein
VTNLFVRNIASNPGPDFPRAEVRPTSNAGAAKWGSLANMARTRPPLGQAFFIAAYAELADLAENRTV